MIARFFTRASRPDAQPARVPAGRRVYAIGDIHGCLEPLHKLHALIQEHAAKQPPAENVVVYLGDYVDRGPDSCGVIDLLLAEPLTGFEHVYLKGNHEDSLCRFLANGLYGPQWVAYGGDATLYSYGVRPPLPQSDTAELQRIREDFAQRLPRDHVEFFEGLRLAHFEGDYAFVHAGVRPGVAFDRQVPEDLLWIRDEFLRSDVDFGKIVVHGHSITEVPTTRRNRIGIDTGAFASGRLTCLVLEDTSRAFLMT